MIAPLATMELTVLALKIAPHTTTAREKEPATVTELVLAMQDGLDPLTVLVKRH